MIANASVDSQGILEGEIGDGDEYDVQANNDQGSNAKIGNNVAFDIVESLASVECSEQKTEIDGVEEGNVKHMIS